MLLSLLVAPVVAALALRLRHAPFGSLLAAPPAVAAAAAWGEPGLGLIVGVALLPLWEQRGRSDTAPWAVVAAAAGGGGAAVLAAHGGVGGFLQEGFLAAVLAAGVGAGLHRFRGRFDGRRWLVAGALAPTLTAAVGVALLTAVPEAVRGTAGWVSGALLAAGLGALVVRRAGPTANLRVAALLALLGASEVVELGQAVAVPLLLLAVFAAVRLIGRPGPREAKAWRAAVVGLAVLAVLESPWIPWQAGGVNQFPGFGHGGRELGPLASYGVRPLFGLAGGGAAARGRPFAVGALIALPAALVLLLFG